MELKTGMLLLPWADDALRLINFRALLKRGGVILWATPMLQLFAH